MTWKLLDASGRSVEPTFENSSEWRSLVEKSGADIGALDCKAIFFAALVRARIESAGCCAAHGFHQSTFMLGVSTLDVFGRLRGRWKSNESKKQFFAGFSVVTGDDDLIKTDQATYAAKQVREARNYVTHGATHRVTPVTGDMIDGLLNAIVSGLNAIWDLWRKGDKKVVSELATADIEPMLDGGGNLEFVTPTFVDDLRAGLPGGVARGDLFYDSWWRYRQTQ